jgi:hypothetical protein
MQSRAVVLMFSAAAAVAGCAAVQPVSAPRPSTPAIQVPFYAQDVDQCGPAALAMVLAWSGVNVSPPDLAREVFTPKRRGSLQPDLVTASRRHGRIAYPIHGRDELFAEIDAGHPVVVLQNIAFSWAPRWHYAVAIGHDASDATVTLHSGDRAGVALSEKTFFNTWERAGSWGLVTLPPDRLPANLDETRWLEAVIGLERAGRSEEAIVAYRRAAERWPLSLAARIGWANAAYAAGDLRESETALHDALRCRPDSAVAWNNLAHVLGMSGRKDEALAAAHRAIEIGGPDVGIYRETLAEIEAR